MSETMGWGDWCLPGLCSRLAGAAGSPCAPRLPLCHVCAHIPSSHKDTRHWVRPTPRPGFTLTPTLQVLPPTEPHSEVPGFRTSIHAFLGDTIPPISVIFRELKECSRWKDLCFQGTLWSEWRITMNRKEIFEKTVIS